MSLKIPPILLVVLMILGQIELLNWLPLFQIKGAPIWVSLMWGAFGLAICVLGVVEVKRQATTIDPRDPSKSTSLICSGVYKYSRNPMYLGMTFFLIGTGIYLGDVSCFFAVIFFVLYINKYQIKPEEDALFDNFGEEFTSYKKQTRPWI